MRIAQTPAPKKDRIYGSKLNKPNSASSKSKAKSIKLSESVITSIKSIIEGTGISLATAKAVVRRGMGAYSKSHRPTIKGGKPNSRVAWGLARLNAFVYKAEHGKSKSGKYTQDDDLLRESGFNVNKYHLGGDMSKHLAPNGKPSNLTHEQWHLVRTPEFKAWFGDWENSPETASKVVDENGEPLVVFHASPTEFNVFDYGRSDLFGWHFGTKKAAEKVGKQRTKKLSSRIYFNDFFLNIRSPYEIFDTNDHKKPSTLRYQIFTFFDDFKINKDKLEEWDNKGDWAADFRVDFYKRKIQGNKNYDGFKYWNKYEDKRSQYQSWVANKPTQIKLADGSNTTFDGGNPDIRFEDGGNISVSEKLINERMKCIHQSLIKKLSEYENQNQYDDLWVEVRSLKRRIDGYFQNGKFGMDRGEFDEFQKSFFTSDDDKYKYGRGEEVTQIFPNLMNQNIRIWRAKGDAVLYRGVSVEDWARIQNQGYIDSDMRGAISEYEGINLAQTISVASTYLPRSKDGVILAIDTKGLDMYILSDEYIRLFEPIPIKNVIKVSEPITKDEFGIMLSEKTNEKIKEIEDWLNENSIEVDCDTDIRFKDGGKTPYVSDDFQIGYDGAYEHLVAPNGEPSNLTPEQYKLVRTPAFKKWFGDWENDSENASKVVDSNGEPMVLYHGTDVNFNVYDLSKIGEGSDLLGKGIYLTENKDVANFYANLVSKKRYIKGYEDGFFGSKNAIYEEDADEKAEKHKLIYEFFVNAKNIKNINQININNDLKQILIKSISFMFGDKSEDVINSRIDFADKNHNQIRNYRGKIIYLIEQFPDAKKEILEYIKNKYDCIFFEPTTEFESNLKDYKNYVIFKPNQIKLADGTNTTFDDNNLDIRFKKGGQVNYNQLIKAYELALEVEQDAKKKKLYQDIIDGYEIASELNEPKKTKSILLAPNGKPSNLTPEQYKLVRKPEFKAWFGDWENDPENSSKVVDENGEPLVVYNAGYEKFNVFNTKKQTKRKLGNDDKSAEHWKKKIGYNEWVETGGFFTDSRLTASLRSTDYTDEITNIYQPQGYVIECFLNIRNPLVNGKKGDERIWWDVIPVIFNQGYLESEHDGFIANGIIEEDDYQNTYNVKNPEQIKLADGTNTTFDGSNPDIRYADGGIVDIAEWETKEPELFECLLTIRDLVEANATVKDSFVDTHNNLYVIKYEDSNPYFDSIITETCKTLAECKDYLEVGEVEVTDMFVLVPLVKNPDIRYEEGANIACVDFINKTKSIFNNGYYHDFGNFVLISYNSGGQKELNVYQTINPLLAKEMSELLSIADSDCLKLIYHFYDKARRLDSKKILNELKGKHIIVSNRDSVECSTFNRSNLDIRFDNGGSVLLAPSGKPSKLSPEQYKLVRTPEFKKWFGDWEKAYETGSYDDVSKVIDEETKEPLVVYHGSNSEFTVFDEKFNNYKGFYFTSYKDYSYITKYTKIVLPCFLQIKNPPKIEPLKMGLGRQYVVFNNQFLALSFLDIQPNEYNKIKELGFDGMIGDIKDGDYELKNAELVVFNPNQIKLADGTNTTFDSSNPDIRFDNGGGVNYSNNEEERELAKIKDKYDADYNYFESEIYGQPYKIRMNKNHPRNTRNDDDFLHNLSLVNVKYPSAKVIRESNNGKLQWQYDQITDWEDAKSEIENFFNEIKDRSDSYKSGGSVSTDLYEKWKSLVNMSASELKQFVATKEGKEAGLTKGEADELGIKSGHESAKWILKMKATDVSKWTPTMWEWAKRQVSFISRMRGNKGGLYDQEGNKTRKHTSLLIWGHNPEQFNGGGEIDQNTSLTELAMDIEKDHKQTFNKIKLAEKYLSFGNYKLARKIILGDNVKMLLNHFSEEEEFVFPKIRNNSNKYLIDNMIEQHIKFEKLFQKAENEPDNNLIIAQIIVLLKSHITKEYELIKHLI